MSEQLNAGEDAPVQIESGVDADQVEGVDGDNAYKSESESEDEDYADITTSKTHAIKKAPKMQYSFKKLPAAQTNDSQSVVDSPQQQAQQIQSALTQKKPPALPVLTRQHGQILRSQPPRGAASHFGQQLAHNAQRVRFDQHEYKQNQQRSGLQQISSRFM